MNDISLFFATNALDSGYLVITKSFKRTFNVALILQRSALLITSSVVNEAMDHTVFSSVHALSVLTKKFRDIDSLEQNFC